LLNAGAASEITGVELSADTVQQRLKRDHRFRLIVGDIATISLPDCYDVCIYGAVHHHVLNDHGLDVAVSVLHKIIANCKDTIFFETGHLTEGGWWPWQRTMHRYFRTDEAHVHYLLSCIECYVNEFDIIGKFSIHGIRRWLIKIDVNQEKGKRLTELPGIPRICIQGSAQLTHERTFGSKNQKLVRVVPGKEGDSPVLLGTADLITGQKAFLKRHVHRPYAGMKEFWIGQQVQAGWAIRSLGTLEDRQTLAFPFVENSRSISELAGECGENRQRVATLVLHIFKEAGKSSIALGSQVLLPCIRSRSVLEICDLNPNNWLITGHSEDLSVVVVDFEQQHCNYLWRNRVHLGTLLWKLRRHRLRALAEFIKGMAGMMVLLVTYQFKSADARIRDRQSSLVSVLISAIRSQSGKVARYLFDSLGYR
jgi:hypothetical protein